MTAPVTAPATARSRLRRSTRTAAAVLLAFAFFSSTAEIWANRAPLAMSYHGSTYFPAFKYYHPSIFGREDLERMDYRSLTFSGSDWALWPPIKWDAFARNEKASAYPSPPSAENWLGTDESGRDIAARLLYGFRYSIGYALIVWIFSSLVGIAAGSVMGYAGGAVDLVGQRVVEIIDSLPYLMVLVTLASIFKPGLLSLAAITVAFSWVGISAYFRAEFLKYRRQEFTQAARAIGAGAPRIAWRHILPNSLTPWLTISPFLIATNVAGLAALDFLGYGLQAPTPSWGELLNEASKNFRTAWWLAVFPSAALFFTLLLLNIVGEGVRQASDPKTRTATSGQTDSSR